LFSNQRLNRNNCGFSSAEDLNYVRLDLVMSTLLETAPFAPVSDILIAAADEIRRTKVPILLLAAPSIEGSLSLSPIEAALVDSGIPYRRRFKLEAPSEGSWIHILGSGDETGPRIETNPFRLTIAGKIVKGLTGHRGDERKGLLTAIAQCNVLGQLISPQGLRIRRMKPWVLSGNWLHSSLDTTYDPVFTAIRDQLVEEGIIRVVCLPEVPEPNVSIHNWIDPTALDAITSRWPTLDVEGRARALSHLVKPSLARSTPSTARLEEIIWHCVLSSGWSTDLAGQITTGAQLWKEYAAPVAAAKLVDKLLRDGKI